MNRVVRVVERKYNKVANKLTTRNVINEVVAANTAKEARKVVRKKYGPTALIGFNRPTNKELGTYVPVEKELLGKE